MIFYNNSQEPGAYLTTLRFSSRRIAVDPLEVGFAEACKYGVKPWSTGSKISVNKLLSKKKVN